MAEMGHSEDCYCQICIPANPLAPSRRPSSRWHMLWALPWMLVTWVIVEGLVFLPLYLVGLIVFPIAVRRASIQYCDSRVNKGILIEAFAWPWLDEWLGNHEDGLLPWGWEAQGGTAYSWFLRNPVNNMRFWPVVSIRPTWVYTFVGFAARGAWIVEGELPNLHFCGTVTEIVETPGWFVAWCRGRVGCRWIWHKPFWGTKGIALGWHLNPRDQNGIPMDDVRRFGIGIVCQRLKADEVTK